MKIILLQGGSSLEREISLRSSAFIGKAIENLGHELSLIDPADYENIEDFIVALRKERADLVFIGLHGGAGEDGRMQAILKTAGIPFTGSNHKSSAIAMDKYVSSYIAKNHGIPVPRQEVLTFIPFDIDRRIESVGFPMVVKPNGAGSSVGVFIVNDKDEMLNAFGDAFSYDESILMQQFISGRELTVSILCNDALPVIEIIVLEGFYDYTNKYTKGKTEYICPAELTDEETKKIQEYAKRIFHAIGCTSYGRVDFMYDGNEFYFLELNTLPGMTELSLVPMAAKEVGIEFEKLIELIMDNVELV